MNGALEPYDITSSSNLGGFTLEQGLGGGLYSRKHSILQAAGLIKPRKIYESKEDRKAAAKERAKDRRLERKEYLKSQGLASDRAPKLSKEQKRVKNKELRRLRNDLLRKDPVLAVKLGVDLRRLRV